MTVSRFDFLRGFVPGLDDDSCEFNIVHSKAGFTTVVGLAFGPDGLLYVLELSAQAGDPAPGAEKVVRIKRSGEIEEVATGLIVPTAMTLGPDGKLYVSNLGAVPGAGAGQILQIDVR
jgi:glucose/arabinose dehydrogenase